MNSPVRIQLSRKAGWKMPPNCVKVDRTTKWGNPWRLSPELGADQAVAIYSRWLHSAAGSKIRLAARAELRGKSLGCWCACGAPCHGDALLELANA